MDYNLKLIINNEVVMNIDKLLVQHCAPTLAGLKIASLICVDDNEYFDEMVQKYNSQYNKKGIYFYALAKCKGRRLLYIYRQKELNFWFQKKEIRKFLDEYGYFEMFSIKNLLNILSQKFLSADNFPHELGIFLGYPLEDVKGFIQYGGNDAKYCGEWKVYTDVDYARVQFAKYETCRRCYINMFNRGFSISKLIIA